MTLSSVGAGRGHQLERRAVGPGGGPRTVKFNPEEDLRLGPIAGLETVSFSKVGDKLRLVDSGGGTVTFQSVEPVFDVAITDLGDIGLLTEVSFDSVIGGLENAASYLEGLDDPFLTTALPVINVGINDVLDYGGAFRAAVESLAEDPVTTVDKLVLRLTEALGLAPLASTAFGIANSTGPATELVGQVAPKKFAFEQDISFLIASGSTVTKFTVAAADTSGNADIDDLAADIEAAIGDANIAVTAVGGVLKISTVDGTTLIEFLDDAASAAPVEISFDNIAKALRIALPFQVSSTEETPIFIDFQSLGINFGEDILDFIGTGDESLLNLTASADVDLQFGIDLTTPAGAQVPVTVAADAAQDFTSFDELVALVQQAVDGALAATPGYESGDIVVGKREAFDQFNQRIQDSQGRDTFELTFTSTDDDLTVLSALFDQPQLTLPLPADGKLPVTGGVLVPGGNLIFVPATGVAGDFILAGEALDDDGEIIPAPTVSTAVPLPNKAELTVSGGDGTFVFNVLGQVTAGINVGASADDVAEAIAALPGFASSDVSVLVDTNTASVTVDGTTGFFTLTLNGEETAEIAAGATAGDVAAKLTALAGVSPGQITVTKTGSTYEIVFNAALGVTDAADFRADAMALVTVAEEATGYTVDFHASLGVTTAGDVLIAATPVMVATAAIPFDADAQTIQDELQQLYPFTTVTVTGDKLSGFSVTIADGLKGNEPFEVAVQPKLEVASDNVEQGFVVNLDLDGATGPSLNPVLFTGDQGTKLDLQLFMSGGNLVFPALAGPAQVFVRGGTVTFNRDGLASPEGVTYSISLGDVDGRVGLNDQATLDQLTRILVEGFGNVRLPLFDAPDGELLVRNIPFLDLDLDFNADTDLRGEASFFNLPAFELPPAPDPLVQEPVFASQALDPFVRFESPTLTFDEQSALELILANPELFVDGVDSLFLNVEDSIAANINDVPIPLIGSGLGEVTNFISGISEDLLTFLNFALRRSDPVLSPFDLIRQVLFDVFGPSVDDVKARNTVQTIQLQSPFDPLGLGPSTFKLRLRDSGIEVTTVQRSSATQNEVQTVTITANEDSAGDFRFWRDGLESFAAHYVGTGVRALTGHAFNTEFKALGGQSGRLDPNDTGSYAPVLRNQWNAILADDVRLALEGLYGEGNVKVRLLPTANVSVGFDGASASGVDLANDKLLVGTSKIVTGDPVFYSSGQGAGVEAVEGLVDNALYYAVVDASGNVQLALTEADALAASPTVVDLTNLGVGAAHALLLLSKGFDFDGSAASAVDVANDKLLLGTTGLTTGDAVLYSNGSATGAAPIGGLTTDRVYFAVVDGAGDVQLAASLADATAATPTVIDLTAAGAGTGHSLSRVSTVKFNNYNLEFANELARSDVEPVFGFSESLLGNLESTVALDPATLTATTLQQELEKLPNIGEGNVRVGISGNKFVVSFVGDLAGLAVPKLSADPAASGKVTITTTSPGGVGNAAVPFRLELGSAPIEFDGASSSAVDLANDTIDFGTNHGFLTGDNVIYRRGAEGSATFDGSQVTNVDLGNDKLLVGALGAGFITGDRVVYRVGGAGASAIGGLVDGDAYFAVVDANGDVQLAETEAEALSATPTIIDLVGVGGGDAHTLTGDGRAIGGLVNETVYYAVKVSATAIKLATSKENAKLTVPEAIDLSTLGQGNGHSINNVQEFGALNILRKLNPEDATPLSREDVGLRLLGDFPLKLTTTEKTTSSSTANTQTTTSTSKFGLETKKPKLKGFEFEINLGQNDIFDVLLPPDSRPSVDISFDIGTDKLGFDLGLDVDAVLDLSLGWDLRLNFGFDSEFGFYTHTEQAKVAGKDVPELAVTLAATLERPKDDAQQISVLATQGRYELSFKGETTDALDYDATAADVQTALAALSTIGSGNVEVTPLANESNPTTKLHQVRFKGDFAGKEQEIIIARALSPVADDGNAATDEDANELLDGLDQATLTVERLDPIAPVSSLTQLPLGAEAVGNLGPLTLKARDLIPGPGETDPRKQRTRIAAIFAIDVKDPDRNLLPIVIPPTGVLAEDVTLKIGVPVIRPDGETEVKPLSFTVTRASTVTNNQITTDAAGNKVQKPIDRLLDDIQFALDDAISKQPQSGEKAFGVQPGDIEVVFDPVAFGFKLKAADQGVTAKTLVDSLVPLVKVVTEQEGSSSTNNIADEKQLIIFSPQASASEANPFDVTWKTLLGREGTAQIKFLDVNGIKDALVQLPQISTSNISVDKVSDISSLRADLRPVQGSKVFRVTFGADTAGLQNLGGRNQNPLIVENPNAKGTAAERGEPEKQLIKFTKDAFETEGENQFQILFNGKPGTDYIDRSDASSPFTMAARIRNALQEGLGQSSISVKAFDLKKVGEMSYEVIFRGDEFKDVEVPQLVLQRKLAIDSEPTVRSSLSGSDAIEVDLDGDRLTFKELISPQFKIKDILEGKVTFTARSNLFLDLFVAQEAGETKRNTVVPRLFANFHFDWTLAEFSTSAPAKVFGRAPFPLGKDGKLTENQEFTLVIKGGKDNTTENVKVTLNFRDTDDNNTVFDLVGDVQRKVDLALKKSSFDKGVKVQFNRDTRQIEFIKNPDSKKQITEIKFRNKADGPKIGFTKVSLALGSFLNDFIGPFLGNITTFVAPFNFLIGPKGLLTARLPVLSDVSGQTVTLLTLARAFGQDGTANFIEGLGRILDLSSQVNAAAANADRPNNEIVINFGDFDINQILDKKSGKDLDLDKDVDQKKEEDKPADQARDGDAKRFTQSVSAKATTEGALEFSIPILTDPTQAYKLLLGQFDDATFITVDLPTFIFSFDYSAKFNIYGPLFANLGGGFSAAIDLAFGYDGTGLARAQRIQSDFGAKFLAILDGFFISDTTNPDGTGRDKPELTFKGEISAGASLNAGVAEAGVEGGIRAIVKFDLNDPNKDGRVRFSEIVSNIEVNGGNPVAFFDISGKIEWFLRAYVEAFWGLWRKEFEFGRGTIFDFKSDFIRKPILAADEGGGSLLLHMGPQADARIHGNVDDGDESFVITGNSDRLSVSFDGFSTTYYGINRISGFGGEGNDTADFSGLTGVDIEFFGGAGNDTIKGGSGNDLLAGEGGDDLIEGGSGNDQLFGGQGNDPIRGGAGNDVLRGDENEDLLEGGGGDDIISGGSEDDTLRGGTGGDRYVFLPNWGRDTVEEPLSSGGSQQQPPLLDPNSPTPDIFEFSLVPYALTHSAAATASGQKLEITDGENTVVQAGSEIEIEVIRGARGFDFFDIRAAGAGGLQLDGGRSSDTYLIGRSDDILGPVLVQDTGPIYNFDQLIVETSDAAETVGVSQESAKVFDQGVQKAEIFYRPTVPGTTDPVDPGIEVIQIDTLGGNDTINIEGTPEGAALRLNTGAGDDTINIGVNAVTGAAANVNRISGNLLFGTPLVIQGKGDETTGRDSLNLFDTTDGANNTGEMFSRAGGGTRIRGLGMAVDIEYSKIDAVSLQLGGGNDTFTVRSTHRGSFALNAGGGADTINVRELRAGTATDFGATIDGGAGADTINLGSTAPEPFAGVLAQTEAQGSLNRIKTPLTVLGGGGAGDVLNVDESADANNNGVLTSTQIIGLAGRTSEGDKPDITYGTFEELNLRLGRALPPPATEIRAEAGFNDVFTIEGTHTGTTRIDSFDGDDLFLVMSLAGPTFINSGNDNDRIDVGRIVASAVEDEYRIFFRGQLAGIDVPLIETLQTEVFDLGPAPTDTLTLADTPAEGVVKIAVNGIPLDPADFTLTGNTVTFDQVLGGVTPTETFDLAGGQANSAVQLANVATPGSASVTLREVSEFFDVPAEVGASVVLEGTYLPGSVKVFAGRTELSAGQFTLDGQRITLDGVPASPLGAGVFVTYDVALDDTRFVLEGDLVTFTDADGNDEILGGGLIQTVSFNGVPTETVTLSGNFVADSVAVAVGTVTLAPDRFRVDGNVLTFLDAAGAVEARTDNNVVIAYDVITTVEVDYTAQAEVAVSYDVGGTPLISKTVENTRLSKADPLTSEVQTLKVSRDVSRSLLGFAVTDKATTNRAGESLIASRTVANFNLSGTMLLQKGNDGPTAVAVNATGNGSLQALRDDVEAAMDAAFGIVTFNESFDLTLVPADFVFLSHPPKDGVVDSFVVDDLTQSFDLSGEDAAASSVALVGNFTPANVQVFVGGSQLAASRYSISGGTLTFRTAGGAVEERSDADIQVVYDATLDAADYVLDGKVLSILDANGDFARIAGTIDASYQVRNVNVGVAGTKLTLGHEFDTLSFADSYTLTFGGATTAPIAVGASAATVQAALELLPGVDPGDIVVHKVGTVDGIGGLLTVDGGQGNVTSETLQDGATPPDVGEIQLLTVLATAGDFDLTLTRTAQGTSATTATPLSFAVDAPTLETAIVGLADAVFGGGSVVIDGADVDVEKTGNDFVIRFQDDLIGIDIDELVVDATNLTGAAATVTAVNGFSPQQLTEFQKFTVNAGAGTFRLGFFDGVSPTPTFTAPIAVGAGQEVVKTALVAAIQEAGIAVSGDDIAVVFGQATNSYTIEFKGIPFTGFDVPLMTVDESNLAFANVIVVSDSGDDNDNLGTLTEDLLTGLDMAGGIAYTNIAEFNLDLGAGNDTLTVEGTHANPTFLEGFDGEDAFEIETASGLTTLNTGAGADTVKVGDEGFLEGIAAPLNIQGDGLDLTVDVVTEGSQLPVTAPVDEVQRITIDGLGGKFTLEFDGATTAELDINDSNTVVATALTDLPTIDVGDVVVTRQQVSPTRVVYTAAFAGGLGGRNLTPLVARAATQDLLKVDDSGDVNPDEGILGDRLLLGLGMAQAEQSFDLSAGPQSFVTLANTVAAETVRIEVGGTEIAQSRFEVTGRVVNFIDATGASETRSDADIVIRYATGGLNYSRFESLDVGLGRNDDVFFVHGTHSGETLVDGGDRDDEIFVERVSGKTLIKGGTGADRLVVNNRSAFPDVGNQIGAELTLDGDDGSDRFVITMAGGGSSLINVFDTGDSKTGQDRLTIAGTAGDDTFLLRASKVGREIGYVALLADDGVSFERVNYDKNINDRLIVNAAEGDDSFYVDDNAVKMTLSGGIGDDFFQFGQVYATERTAAEAGIALDDVLVTTETTRGFLSNGISEATTASGGEGEDEFVVLRNINVLSLVGGDGDDSFTVRAFALAGSQDDKRERTDISGDAGADLVQYAVNAPVSIKGGDGFDTVIVVGTEFGDDFVVTEDGVFGAGLNINFAGVEAITADGAEGDDRFFVLGTNPDLRTTIVGGLGSDSVSIGGDSPSVVSNDLLGHSGLIAHSVESVDTNYDGLKVAGLSANVADNDEPAVRITPTGGSSRITEGGDVEVEGEGLDTYSVVLTRRPTRDVSVTVSAEAPLEEDEAKGAQTFDVQGPPPGIGAGPSTIVEAPETAPPPRTIVDREATDLTGSPQFFNEGSDKFITRLDRVDFGLAPFGNSNLGNDDLPYVEVRANINSNNDIDWYRLDLRRGERVTFDIDFGSNSGNSVDTQLHLYDAFARLLRVNDDASTSRGGGGSVHRYDSYIEYTAARSGIHWLAVTSYNKDGSNGFKFNNNGRSSGDYRLYVSIDASLNNTVGSAVTVSRAAFGLPEIADPNVGDPSLPFARVNGVLNTADDVDFYRFDLRDGEELTLDVDFARQSGTGPDTILTLFNSAGTKVAQNDDAATSNGGAGSSSGLDSFLKYTVPTGEGGAYFAAVTSYANFGVDGPGFTGGGGSTGSYTVFASLDSDQGPVTGSIDSATIIDRSSFGIGPNPNVGEEDLAHLTIQGLIDFPSIPNDDVDFYAFDLLAGKRFILDIDFGQAGGADPVDTQLFVFDDLTNVVASNDDDFSLPGGGGSTSGFDPYLEYIVPRDGRYFVAVSSFNNDPGADAVFGSGGSSGDYALNVSLEGAQGAATTLTFTPDNWFIPQVVNVLALDDLAAEGLQVATISHSVIAQDTFDDLDVTGAVNVALGGGEEAGEITFAANALPNIDLRGAQILITGGFGEGQQLTIVSRTGDSLRLSTPWDAEALPDGDSLARLIVDDSLRGGVTATVDNTFRDSNANFQMFGDFEVGDRLIGRTVTVNGETRTITSFTRDTITVDTPFATVPPVGATYTIAPFTVGNATVAFSGAVTSIVQKTFHDNGASFPAAAGDNLRGATIEIVGGTGTGQIRLIESNTANEITVTRAWRTAPDATSVYRIARFDGLALPDLNVEIVDNDRAGLAVTESGDLSLVIEGATGATAGATDSYDLHLTRQPTAPVTVTVTPPAGQLLVKRPADATWSTSLVLNFNAGNWDIDQTVLVRAVDDATVEGPQFELITHTLSSADADVLLTATDVFTLTDPESSVLLSNDPVSGAVVAVTTTDGGPGNEIVDVTIPAGAVGGTFRLKFGGAITEAIDYNADPAVVQDLLEGLSSIDDGDIDVQGSAGQYTITFIGAKGGQDVTGVEADGSRLLTGITVTVDPLDGSGPQPLAGDRFTVAANTLLFLDAFGAPTPLVGEISVTYQFERPGFDDLNAPAVTVELSDNDSPSVLITETDGSTDVVEGGVLVTGQGLTPLAPGSTLYFGRYYT